MKKDYKLLNEALRQNFLKESSNTTDMGGWEPLIVPLIEKLYPETLVSQIADIQPINGPVGKVAAIYAFYTGDKNDVFQEAYLENTKIIAVNAVSGDQFVVGNTYQVSGAAVTAKILYTENVPYSTITGSGGSGDPYTNVAATATMMVIKCPTDNASLITTSTSISGVNEVPIIYTSVNRTSIKKILYKYSANGNDYWTDSAAANTATKTVSYETRTVVMNTKTRKIKTQFSTERLQDLQAVYGLNYKEHAGKVIANDIRQEIDREVITYLKDIATPIGHDIRLVDSIGMTNDLMGVGNDLIGNIMLAGEDIVRATKRNRTFFVLADSVTCAFLQVNPWHVVAEPDKDNPYYVGKIGAYPLYCDMYANDRYILVGYRFESEASGDAGLIFSPYLNTIIEADGSEPMFQKHLLSFNRYGYIRHPQDTGTGIGDSDFFRIMYVDYTGMNGFSQSAGMDGLANFTNNIFKTVN
jgi:hypothetical protein